MGVSSPGHPLQAAERRRLQDRPLQRWMWAVAANLPLVGLPVQVLHAVTRHTIRPLVWSSLLALPLLVVEAVVLLNLGLAFVNHLPDATLLNPDLLRRALVAEGLRHLPVFAALSLGSMVLGILGHKVGQDRELVATRRRRP